MLEIRLYMHDWRQPRLLWMGVQYRMIQNQDESRIQLQYKGRMIIYDTLYWFLKIKVRTAKSYIQSCYILITWVAFGYRIGTSCSASIFCWKIRIFYVRTICTNRATAGSNHKYTTYSKPEKQFQ